VLEHIDVSEVCTASIMRVMIILMMEEVPTSETSVYSETAWRYIREGSHLHSRRCENLKPHIIIIIIIWL
jgi:hypothetical protein